MLLSAQGAMTTELSAQLAPYITTPTHQTILESSKSHSLNSLNQKYTDAVVNILRIGSGDIRSGTASGVVVSPTGLVLANAHVAQYMLLGQESDANVKCTLRTGAPATNTYKARVIYIPPQWIAINAIQIKDREQYGTGDYDYAILQITDKVDGLPYQTLSLMCLSLVYLLYNT
jgi:hypothetical protein